MAMSEFRHMTTSFFSSYIPANNRLCVGGHKNFCTLKVCPVSKLVSVVNFCLCSGGQLVQVNM